MAASRKAIQGRGVIILNILRGLNICGLILLSAAHWIMIVTSGISGQFFFFDFASHLFMFALAILLFMTEVGWPSKFISETWPAFGPNAGFLALAGLQIAMGCFTLGDLAKPMYSIDSLGLALWRVVMAAGILSIVFGFFNIIATFFFEDRQEHISARRVRASGSLAEGPSKDFYAPSTHHGGSINSYGERYEKGSVHDQQQGGWARTARRMTARFMKREDGSYAQDDVGLKVPESIHPLYRGSANDIPGDHEREDSSHGRRMTRYSTSSRLSQFSEIPPIPPAATMPKGPYDNLPGGRI